MGITLNKDMQKSQKRKVMAMVQNTKANLKASDKNLKIKKLPLFSLDTLSYVIMLH